MDWNHDGKTDAKDSTLYHCCIRSNESPKTNTKPPTVRQKSAHRTTNHSPKQNSSSSSGCGVVAFICLIYFLLKLICG